MNNENQTYNQLSEQQSNLPPIHSDKDLPTVLVKRSNGDITTGRFLGPKDDHYSCIAVETYDGEEGLKAVKSTNLSDGKQFELAQELADTLPVKIGLGIAAVEANYLEPQLDRSARMASLTAGLSEHDKDQLVQYARALSDKAEAQNQGKGDLSILDGQNAGSALAAMSEPARAIANRYYQAWESS